jgi:hypothetical protein
MGYQELTENQKAGIDYNSSHNGFATVDEYIQMRLVQDADRGYAEMVSLQVAGIIGKMNAEPTIIPAVETKVDEEVAVKVEERRLEEAKLAEVKPIEEVIEEVKVP